MRCSKRLSVVLSAVGAFWLAATGHAQEASRQDAFDEAIAVRGEANEELSASQERIETLSDATDELLTQYQSALRQNESLKIYNRQMDSLIVSQEVERASLEEQTDRVELVSREVIPLMLRMIDALDSFVRLDVPFLEEERTERILDLRKLMHRADVPPEADLLSDGRDAGVRLIRSGDIIKSQEDSCC